MKEVLAICKQTKVEVAEHEESKSLTELEVERLKVERV